MKKIILTTITAALLAGWVTIASAGMIIPDTLEDKDAVIDALKTELLQYYAEVYTSNDVDRKRVLGSLIDVALQELRVIQVQRDTQASGEHAARIAAEEAEIAEKAAGYQAEYAEELAAEKAAEEAALAEEIEEEVRGDQIDSGMQDIDSRITELKAIRNDLNAILDELFANRRLEDNEEQRMFFLGERERIYQELDKLNAEKRKVEESKARLNREFPEMPGNLTNQEKLDVIWYGSVAYMQQEKCPFPANIMQPLIDFGNIYGENPISQNVLDTLYWQVEKFSTGFETDAAVQYTLSTNPGKEKEIKCLMALMAGFLNGPGVTGTDWNEARLAGLWGAITAYDRYITYGY